MANNRRNIAHKLILTSLIMCLSISPVFGFTPEIEIEHNDNEYFHAYNSNTNVANSYIDSGASVFSKAMNYMFMNIAKSTSTVYSIQGIANNMYSKLNNSDTTLTNIATDIGLIKQSNVSQSNSLSSILSDANSILAYNSQIAGTLGYQTTGNLVDIKKSLNEINNINWINSDVTYEGCYTTYNGSSPLSVGQYPAGTYYFRFSRPSNTSLRTNNLYRFVLPVGAYNNVYRNNYISDVEIGFDNAIMDDTNIYYYPIRDNLSVLLVDSILPLAQSNNLIKVTFTHPIYIYENSYFKLQYLENDTLDQLLFKYYYELATVNDNLENLEVSVDANLDDSGIIDAINNLSLQDNDVKLNLTINNNTGSDGTNIITRLQNFFNTGVSVGDFFDNVDDAESGWFTQLNSDVINTLRGGYTNFYE